MPAEPLALVAWAALLAVLVLAAILIGRLTARFFLRAVGTRADGADRTVRRRSQGS